MKTWCRRGKNSNQWTMTSNIDNQWLTIIVYALPSTDPEFSISMISQIGALWEYPLENDKKTISLISSDHQQSQPKVTSTCTGTFIDQTISTSSSIFTVGIKIINPPFRTLSRTIIYPPLRTLSKQQLTNHQEKYIHIYDQAPALHRLEFILFHSSNYLCCSSFVRWRATR